MKLTDLDPKLKENILVFDCPCTSCGTDDWPKGRIRIPILPAANGWSHVSGTFPDSISLLPSIKIGDDNTEACCHWHGYLTNGELVAC